MWRIELKTPLAELKCNAEVALRRNRTPEEYQEALQNVIEDVEQLRSRSLRICSCLPKWMPAVCR